jgi:hypothetical protein
MDKKTLPSIIFIVFLVFCITPNISGSQAKLDNINYYPSLNINPYLSTPDWISTNPHYSTGAALADFNGDGWLDLVISDGNDIEKGRLNVYYNNEGFFPTTANWQSSDLGYNGHLDVGDVNGDGWPDVAVSYLGTSSSFGPIARVYLNNDGELSSIPDWTSDITGNSFGVDFGDMNNDGRPDLAVATGWSYAPYYNYHNYVYLNVDGNLESTASWISDDIYTYQGTHWVDADDDGWLDLAYIGTGQETYIYKNNNGNLETTASWNTSDSINQDGIMLTSGDVNFDGIKDLFTTDNTQLGGSGRFKQYNGITDGFFETTYSWNYYEYYGSAVTLTDVNYDDKLDLATGGWWDHTRIFINDGSGLPNNPTWSSGETSVVEKIVFGNVGPDYNEITIEDIFSADENRKLFYLSRQNIQKIMSVKCDDIYLDSSEYTYSREHSWITVKTAPTNSVEVSYKYSKSQDMIVSNWDAHIGNFLYYNRINEIEIPDLLCEGELNFVDISQGSMVNTSFTVENVGDEFSELNWEITSFPNWGRWTFNPNNGYSLTPEDGALTVNVSITIPSEQETEFYGEIRIINSDDQNDFCEIDVYLKTPKIKSINNPGQSISSSIIKRVPKVFQI